MSWSALLCVLVARGALALPVPPPLVALNTTEGLARLAAGGTLRAAFDAAFLHLVTQEDEASCARASAVTALNALGAFGVGAPVDTTYAPYPYWTQDAYVASACVASNCTAPCTLDEAARALGCALGERATATARHAARGALADAGALRALIAARVADAGAGQIVANFERGAVGMDGTGHFSPVVAFEPESDSALVLDVARYKYPPVWMPVETLFAGINTTDASARDTRGLIDIELVPAGRGAG